MYDVIVVGGGHAGCEAAHACAKLNKKTLLITGNINNIADMACNPSVGGSAKGIIVREIDALGGLMGKVTDKSLIQIKLLNSKKGPAVRALRSQIDKSVYPQIMMEELRNTKNLDIKEGMVENLIVEEKTVKGIELDDSTKIYSSSVILTTGTYLSSDIMIGDTRRREGPHGEKPSNYLSEKLREYGFEIIRLKTGTPPRIDKETIDFTKTTIESGDDELRCFNHLGKFYYNVEEQVPCYLTYTNLETHKIITKNLNKSSMYGGLNDITGVGPRYCPSIEDKIVRFNDKERHQLFLEPETRNGNSFYIQGLSTSMPIDIQEKIIRSINGLENVKILKYAYAIEYDAIKPTQLNGSLETKILKNLFTAGQINGTSGYEEAACQGIMAGINAALKLDNKEPLIIRRDEGYIGVLIDDLITKGVIDPYRLLTSRAEYRLLLRNDNADIRLTEYGFKVGLIDDETYCYYQKKLANIDKLTNILKTNKLNPSEKNNLFLKKLNSSEIKDGITFYNLLKRPEITINNLKEYINVDYDDDVKSIVELNIKYEGYIKKALKEAETMINLETKKIPENINYHSIPNLASEAKQKLTQIKPTSIGQALRISGVNPSDITVLMIYLKRGTNE